MNIKTKISVGFFAVIFLLSSTGMFLIYHECETCDVSEIFINVDKHEHEKDHDFESHHEHKLCCSGSACESETEGISDCCDDDAYYLKISEPYTFSFFQVKFENVFYVINTLFSYKDKFQNTIISSINQINKPPDLLSGKSLLHNICILIL